MDGYLSADEMLVALRKTLSIPGLADMISHIKINDGVHNPDEGGPEIIADIKNMLVAENLPIEIMLDFKVADISSTVINVIKKYLSTTTGILTVSSSCSTETFIKLRKAIPNFKLALVSALTDISNAECQARFGQSSQVKIYNDLMNIRLLYQESAKSIEGWSKPEPVDLVVCSKDDLIFLKKNLPESYGFIVPGVRDYWMSADQQKRRGGIREIIDLGADYAVIFTQLIKGNPAAGISAEESCRMTQEEIGLAKGRFVVPGDPLATLKKCGGYYVSPKDKDGKYIGPLVPYAGTYLTDSGPKNKVGFKYYNFAKAERVPAVRRCFAKLIADQIRDAKIPYDAVIGAPMGGILLAGSLGDVLDCSSIFAEKKVVNAANPQIGRKEESELVIDRHEIDLRDKVIIVEDVCNNFSTTQKLKNLLQSHGAELVAIVCAFNRSGETQWNGVPVISAHFIPTEQFQQDDDQVADLVTAQNIVWQPKDNWEVLMEAMNSTE